MGKYQGIFKRVEKKYLLNHQQYEWLMYHLRNRMAVDKYGKVTICNIYFDTPNHLLIRTSIDKPVYKEKLRLRSYGIPGENSTVFIELKKKFKGVVYKRRESLKYEEAVDYLYHDKAPKKDTQIMKEIDWFKKFYTGLRPAMFISYDRIAMYDVQDENLRITFDTNICWREQRLNLSDGSWGEQLLEPGETLMEIKIPGAMPVWLSSILDSLYIYPISFSKYGTAYKQTVLNKNHIQGGANCA